MSVRVIPVVDKDNNRTGLKVSVERGRTIEQQHARTRQRKGDSNGVERNNTRILRRVRNVKSER